MNYTPTPQEGKLLAREALTRDEGSQAEAREDFEAECECPLEKSEVVSRQTCHVMWSGWVSGYISMPRHQVATEDEWTMMTVTCVCCQLQQVTV